MRISDWSSDVCSSDLLIRSKADLPETISSSDPGADLLRQCIRICFARECTHLNHITAVRRWNGRCLPHRLFRLAAICQAGTKRPEQPFWRFTAFSYRSARSQHGAFPLGRIDTADPNSRNTLSLHAKLLRSGARQVDHPTTD